MKNTLILDDKKRTIEKHSSIYRTLVNILSFIFLINFFGLVIGIIEGITVKNVTFYFLTNTYFYNNLYSSNAQYFGCFASVSFLARLLESFSSTMFRTSPLISPIAHYVISGLFALGITILFFLFSKKAFDDKKKYLLILLIGLSVDTLFFILVITFGECLLGIIIPLAIRLISFIVLVFAFIEYKKLSALKEKEIGV